MKLLMFVCVIANRLQQADTATCNAGTDYFGTVNPNSKAGTQDGNSGTGYILLGTESRYEIDCCGVVTQWEAVIDVTGTETVYLQIWRPSGSSYQLVGENAESVDTNGETLFAIAVGSQIAIRSGDRLGWYSSNTNVIEHKNGPGPDNNFLAMAKPSVGDIPTWSDATVESGRTYAIRADVDGGAAPSFDSPAGGSTYSITNAVSIGYSIETITYSDADASDTLTVTMGTNSKFSFNSTTGELTTASSLAGPTVTESLSFTITDFCGNTDALSIDVIITNEAPVIHNLPASDTLSEDSSIETLLFTINATDTADTVTCLFDASVPAAYPFSVKFVAPTTNNGIYVDGTPNFDYVTLSSYALTVVCHDGYLDSNTRIFYVYLVKNKAPVVHNLQGATTLSTTAAIGSTVFIVSVTDYESDTLTFSMVCSPAACPFNIFASGVIILNVDISSYTTIGYDIEITVVDYKNTVGPELLTVLIHDINDPVLITNLPLTYSFPVPENTVLSSTVFTILFSDQDTQTWTFSMTSSPITGLNYFSLDSAGVISASGNLLNYEALLTAGTTSFTLTVTVNDGTASDTDVLVIDIIDMNEAPNFAQASYSLSSTEAAAGTSLGTPTFGVVDPDNSDSYSYSMDCGTDTAYFHMDSTGAITYQSNYDTDAGLSTTVTCTVTATDVGGLTDTATLYIYITNINDNTPVFSPSSYSFFISYYATAGTTVGTVSATDGDAGSFGTLTYSTDMDEYFTIDNNGQITVQKTPNGNPIGYSTSVAFNTSVTDGGGLSTTASVTVVISDTTTTSTTVVTDRFKTFMEDSRNVAWLVACGVVMAAIIVFLAWFLFTCKGKNSFRECSREFCKKNKRRKRWHRRPETPPTPEPPRRQPRHPPRRQVELISIRQPPPPKDSQYWRTTIDEHVQNASRVPDRPYEFWKHGDFTDNRIT